MSDREKGGGGVIGVDGSTGSLFGASIATGQMCAPDAETYTLAI